MRQKASLRGVVQNLNADIVRELEMPVTQQLIISILDHFDTLCDNLISSLSAEIKTQQKNMNIIEITYYFLKKNYLNI